VIDQYFLGPSPSWPGSFVSLKLWGCSLNIHSSSLTVFFMLSVCFHFGVFFWPIGFPELAVLRLLSNTKYAVNSVQLVVFLCCLGNNYKKKVYTHSVQTQYFCWNAFDWWLVDCECTAHGYRRLTLWVCVCVCARVCAYLSVCVSVCMHVMLAI
jgi:hypothetical protein